MEYQENHYKRYNKAIEQAQDYVDRFSQEYIDPCVFKPPYDDIIAQVKAKFEGRTFDASLLFELAEIIHHNYKLVNFRKSGTPELEKQQKECRFHLSICFLIIKALADKIHTFDTELFKENIELSFKETQGTRENWKLREKLIRRLRIINSNTLSEEDRLQLEEFITEQTKTAQIRIANQPQ